MMKDYEGFINKIRERSAEADFDGMFAGIEKKAAARPKMRLAAAGVLALLLLTFGASLYLVFPRAGNGGAVMAYVFSEEGVNGGPVNAYLFGD